MFILAQNGNILLNADSIVKYTMCHKEDGWLIISGTADGDTTTLARFKEKGIADLAFSDLIKAIAAEQSFFSFPYGSEYENIIKDARVKRKGGS